METRGVDEVERGVRVGISDKGDFVGGDNGPIFFTE